MEAHRPTSPPPESAPGATPAPAPTPSPTPTPHRSNLLTRLRAIPSHFISSLRTFSNLRITHPRSFLTFQTGYYSLVLLSMSAAYFSPSLRASSLERVNAQIEASGSTGKWVVGLYEQGHMASAALMTFLINTTVGAFGTVTLPGFIIPFSGMLVTVYRPIEWGLNFSPDMSESESLMRQVPHWVTLLLEGQAYVLAGWGSWLAGLKLWEAWRGQSKSSAGDEVRGGVEATKEKVEPSNGSRSKWEALWDAWKEGWNINKVIYVPVTIILAVSAVWEAFEVITWPAPMPKLD